MNDDMNLVTWFFLNILSSLRLKTSTSTKAIKLNFGCDKFGEKTVYNLKTAVHFQKKRLIKLIE